MQTQTIVQHALRRAGEGGTPSVALGTYRPEASEVRDLFFARTAAAGPASDDERNAIIRAMLGIVSIGSNQVLTAASRPSELRLIVQGWVYRAQALANGTRQITDILLPGDAIETTSTFDDPGEEMRASGSVQLAVLHRDVLAGCGSAPLRRRWEWMRGEQERLLRSRLVSLGRRDAVGRVTHLMAELRYRLRQVGLVHHNTFTCPLTQEQLGDAPGLTSVHVNRVLQRLRQQGLMIFDRPRVVIPSVRRLHVAAQYERS